MSLDEQLGKEKPAWKVRNEQFKDMLLEETTEAEREYIDNDEGHVPYHFHISGSKLTFQRGWNGFYEVDGENLNLPDSKDQLYDDINFVQSRMGPSKRPKGDDWRKRNEAFKDLLLAATTEAEREYIDNDEGHVPYHFHISGSKLTFQRGWNEFYKVDGVSLNTADTIEQVQKDIKFVQQRGYK